MSLQFLDLETALELNFYQRLRSQGVRTIPGASVTLGAWRKLVEKTSVLFGDLTEISLIHFQALGDVIPTKTTASPPSKGLSEIDTEKLMEVLNAAETQVSTLQGLLPDSADWADFKKRISSLREEWSTFMASDFTNEQVSESVNVTLVGPRPVVDRILKVVQDLVDKETVGALQGQRAGFVPEVLGDIPAVLHEQGGPFPLFATGDKVKNLLEAMGVTIVPAEEVEQFAADQLRREAENTDGKDDADLAVGDDVTEGAHATA